MLKLFDTIVDNEANPIPAAADLMTGASRDALAATDRGIVVPDDGTAPAAAVADPAEGTARAERIAHEHGRDQPGCSFEEAEDYAETPLERFFVDGLRHLSEMRTQVPWGKYGPCFASVLEMTNIDACEGQACPRLQLLLMRLSGHLERQPARWGRKATKAKDARGSSLIGVFRAKVDELPYGAFVPTTETGTQVSWDGMEKLFGLKRNRMAVHKTIRDEMSTYLRTGRLRLGSPYVRTRIPYNVAAAHRRNVIAVIEEWSGPIPLTGLLRRVADMDSILDVAGVRGAELRALMERDATIKAALKAKIGVVGAEHPADPATTDLTFAHLFAVGEQQTVDRYRTTHPTAEPGGASEVAYVRNEISAVRRLMRVNGWDEATTIDEPLFGEGFDAALESGLTGSPGGDRFFRESIRRWRSTARAMVDEAGSANSFDRRLALGISKSGMSRRRFAARIPMDVVQLARWCNGQALPTFLQLHLVNRIEDLLGYNRGQLAESLPELRTGRNTSGQSEIVLSDGRTVQLKRYIRYLPPGALGWAEERLRTAVEKVNRTQFGAVSLNTVRQKAAIRHVQDVGPLDRSAPIFTEWEDLRNFRSGYNDPERVLPAKWEWKSEATRQKNLKAVEGFARWAMLPKAQGGLGLQAKDVSFFLFFNVQVVNKYVIERIKRFSHLEIGGKVIGPILGGTEHDFLNFAKSLLDPDYGWLTQSREMVEHPRVIDVRFDLERMVDVDGKFTIDETSTTSCVVMDAALVARLSDWHGSSRRARLQLASLTGKVARNYQMIRDPHKLVMPILKHRSPIGCVVQMVSDALKRAPSIERAPVEHAKQFRNATAILLLMTVVFRSGTLRQMTYREDGTGHLIRNQDGTYDVRIGADHFKNGHCVWLFGPSWRRRDYERQLGDWASMNVILDHYLTKCRPLLLRGRETDLLFPTGQHAEGWSHKTFNAMITNWTRAWAVPNMRYGTGMVGVLPFGPHAARDIVATHIVRHNEGEERWQRASALLGSSVEVVKQRYAFISAPEEFKKSDPMYKAAIEEGFGTDRLF